MKTMKRMFAVVLAVMLMAAVMVIPASAAGEYTITISNTDHNYKAYQIFAGTLSGKVLSDVVWGSGVNGEALLTALKADTSPLKDLFAGSQTAADVAHALEKQSTATVDAFAKIVANHRATVAGESVANGSGGMSITNLEPGYYIVIDEGKGGKEVAFSRHMIEVVANVTVTPKASAASITKTVGRELNKTYTEAISASFGDTVYFKLDGKLPSHLNDYSQYYYEVVDTLPAGMSYVKVESVEVVNGTASKTMDPSLYTVDTSVAGTIKIVFGDVKADIYAATSATASPTDEIVIKYSAILNTTGTLPTIGGNQPNVNTVQVIYSNNPNNADSKGTTGGDAAYVYCYNVTIDKFDGATDAKLANAEFVLYRPTIGTNLEYAQVDTNNNLTGWTTDKSQASKLTTDSNGKTMVNGIASGTYYIEETAAPASYNKLANAIMVTVTASDSDNNGTLDGLTGQIFYNSSSDTVSADKDTGVVTVSIANNVGAVLPTTGGIGTTIFYVVGAVLVIGAAAAVVLKKRNGEQA